LANVIDGRAGADGMSGNGGDDRYIVDDMGDEVYEDPGMGIDTVESSVSFTLLDDVEHLTLTGTAAINGTGNAAGNALTGNSAANTLTGNAGNDTLDGGAGNDSLVGGAGDDTYLVDSTTDMVTESSNNGNDIVRSTATFTLGANVEQLVLLGTAAVNATGNSANNVLTGNSAANVLNGGSGADTMAGGAGGDSYTVDNAGDVVTELASEGVDTVNSSVTYTLGANVENLTLTGSTAINGTGNSAANVLTGNSAANVLTGGAGDDTYIVGTGDSVVENAGEGIDAVQSGVTWTLATNVESLVLTGTGAINGTGNAANNNLTGNSGANRLDGGAGTDSMAGGGGNDSYVVDNAGDSLTELAAGGTDTVESSVTWVLAAEFENLTLTGSGAINGTGNALVNTLRGNGGANRLDGGTGADSMTGGAGNDTFVVDNTGDTTVEAASGGSDTVEASVTWTLATEVENLTLTGTSAINGTGNGLANTLRGNAANNALNGGAGNDTMIGGAGDDTYTVDSASDVITELTGEGTDSVNSSVTYTLAANVERLTLTGTTAINGTGNTGDNQLTGNSANNNLSGGAGNDSIDGGTGNDTMVGGAGNDTFVVNIATDVVTELPNEGTDTVQSSVTLTLAANVENLTLTGTTAINGTGNTLANVLIGNSAVNTLTGGDGNDTLDGGAGNDSLVGGLGNDTYVVDSASDTINEAASAGTDTVQSSVTLTLTSTNLENLTLLGSAVINGTGNVNANVLTGSGGNNTLAGLEGADTYDGGAGNDTLTDSSTSSSDIYRWGTGQGSDAINDAGGSADRIELAAGIVQSQVSLARSGNHLVVRITGSTDTLTVNNWYAASANKVEEIRLADGSVISLGTAAPLSLAMPSRAWAQIRRPHDELQAGIGLQRAAAAYSPVDGDRAAQSLVQAMAQFGATQAPLSPNAKRWFMDDRRIDMASPL
jgi:Ca2+-binding RTX toxin-like protein